jgi:hypothetical protein
MRVQSNARIATEKLEFMLTLQVRINLPPAAPKAKGTLGKAALQRLFGSPRKKASAPLPLAKDPYHGLGGIIGRDGSFSRSYIALKTYEIVAYGRQFTADITCLNEWALEPGAIAMRGKEMQRMRKRPYPIGEIECQLMFVPCINPSEELPKSMSSAIREMKNAEWFSQLLWEGYLSQQGGDCQVSTPRYFRGLLFSIGDVDISGSLDLRWSDIMNLLEPDVRLSILRNQLVSSTTRNRL